MSLSIQMRINWVILSGKCACYGARPWLTACKTLFPTPAHRLLPSPYLSSAGIPCISAPLISPLLININMMDCRSHTEGSGEHFSLISLWSLPSKSPSLLPPPPQFRPFYLFTGPGDSQMCIFWHLATSLLIYPVLGDDVLCSQTSLPS